MLLLPLVFVVVLGGVAAVLAAGERPGLLTGVAVVGSVLVALIVVLVVGVALLSRVDDGDEPATLRAVEARSDVPVVFQQCDDDRVCGPAHVVEPIDGVAATAMFVDDDLGGEIVVTAAGSTEPIARIPLKAPVAEPRPTPRVPQRQPELDGGRLIAGLAGGAVLLGAAGWLIRRRRDEEPDDPFWGVSIEVPEWEGVEVTLTDEELATYG